MNLSEFKQYSFLQRFDLQPNIGEHNPVVKRDPTFFDNIKSDFTDIFQLSV